MFKSLPVLGLCVAISGCAMFAPEQAHQDQTMSDSDAAGPGYSQFQNKYKRQFAISDNQMSFDDENQTDINFYVRSMMQDLVSNLQYVNQKSTMAVSSFVYLDGSYEHADIVGKQLSESFVHEIHKYGIPIVDFKATDYIRVTQNGDFILSKDFLDLDADLPVKYVLTGTLVKQPTGYLVNARVIGMKSKAVVASAQGKLPIRVVNSLISSDKETGTVFVSN